LSIESVANKQATWADQVQRIQSVGQRAELRRAITEGADACPEERFAAGRRVAEKARRAWRGLRRARAAYIVDSSQAGQRSRGERAASNCRAQNSATREPLRSEVSGLCMLRPGTKCRRNLVVDWFSRHKTSP
jgi:hypothetical protein